jgi:HEAT repeat protein
MLKAKAAPAADALSKLLSDPSEPVRIPAAESLCHIGQTAKGLPVLIDLLKSGKTPWTRLQAANALENIGDKAKPALAALQQATKDPNDYVKRATEYTAAKLAGQR